MTIKHAKRATVRVEEQLAAAALRAAAKRVLQLAPLDISKPFADALAELRAASEAHQGAGTTPNITNASTSAAASSTELKPIANTSKSPSGFGPG